MEPASSQTYRVSFCTSCMGRLFHLRQTLPRNLADHEGVPGVEFVLLDYSCPDGTGDWAFSALRSEIERGRLAYYRIDGLPHFNMTHAKNVAHCLARGEVVCNLDADNFTGAGFAEYLARSFEGRERLVVRSGGGRGTWGRIAFRKSDFLALGGYDERMRFGWGADDRDIVMRARMAGFSQIVFNKKSGFMSALEHSTHDRIKNNLVKDKNRTDQMHKAISAENKARRQIVANPGRTWGEAIVARRTADGMAERISCSDKLHPPVNSSLASGTALDLPERVEPAGSPEVGTNRRILIGICSSHRTMDRRMAVRDTWLRALPQDVAALFFVGAGVPPDERNIVSLPVPDDYEHLPVKVHCFYRYALARHSFDYLFKCDDDTYVHAERLSALPVPGVHFMGSTHLVSEKFASGGAGYLMTRKMVEHLAAGTPCGRGAEDRVFSARALASGMRCASSPHLRRSADTFPESANRIVTAHECWPFEMRRIHAELTGDPPGPAVARFKAIHKTWSGTIRLYADGTFLGGLRKPNGTWLLTDNGHGLVLRWYHWSPGVLHETKDGYEEENMRLEHVDEAAALRWRQFLSGP